MTAHSYVLIGPAETSLYTTPNPIVSRDSIGRDVPQQTFFLTVNGVGAVSATAQPMVSNDRVNWLNYGAPITAAGTTTGVAAQTGNQVWEYYGAVLTAISGTNASAKLTMSA